MDQARQRELGAFYTPPDVVDALLDVALDPVLAAAGSVDDLRALRILDPTCGDGAFLIPARQRLVDRLVELGEGSVEDAKRAVDDAGCVRGWDIDPDALGRCASALGDDRWLRLGDPLVEDLEPIFDVVIGNPPFLDQLDSRTAIDAARRAALQARFPMGSYTDAAALFLLLGVRSLRDDGRLAMIQPLSVLGARDARGVRDEVDELGSIDTLWVAGGRVFADADAQVCALGVVRGAEQGDVRLCVGGAFREVDVQERAGRSWAALGAAAMGVPRVVVDETGPTVGDLAQVGADFREAFYRLASFAREGTGGESARRIATTGLVDPAVIRWGEHEVRFAGSRYTHPVAGPTTASKTSTEGAALEAWIAERAVPKVLVATQTRVIEAAIDPDGTYLPTTPLIWVIPSDTADLARLCAVLLSPVATALAATEGFGTAMSPQAIKLTAARVRAMPLPSRQVPWNEAASLVEQAHRLAKVHEREELLERAAVLMIEAYDVPDGADLLAWWRDRSRAVSRRA